jgi:hypothetical protein
MLSVTPQTSTPITINDLSTDILGKLMTFAGLNSSHKLARTTVNLHARWADEIAQKAALRMQRFWRWCRYFSTTKILAARFMRLRLTPNEMALAT